MKKDCECSGGGCENKNRWKGGGGCGGAVYGLGLIGALFYFLSLAGNFWGVVLGVGKAIVCAGGKTWSKWRIFFREWDGRQTWS